MQAEGYKIKKTKLYGDAKAGLLAVQPDKSVRKSDVSDYILRAEIEKPGDGSGGVEKNYEEKHSLEMDKLRKTNEKLEWELARDQGKYLLKTDVRRESALKDCGPGGGVETSFPDEDHGLADHGRGKHEEGGDGAGAGVRGDGRAAERVREHGGDRGGG